MGNEKVKPSAFLVQCLATLSVSFLATQTGMIVSWPSFAVGIFKSNETILVTPMSEMEISLLGSLTNIGGLVISPFCGYIFDTLGRKHAVMFFGLPFVVAWIIISLTTNVTLVLTAMFLAGIGVAGQAVSNIFISELAQDSIRGGLISCTGAGYFLGILVSYALSGCLDYHTLAYTNLALSVLCVITMMMLRESPVFLIMMGRDKDAAKSLAFYRQVNEKSKEVEMSLNKLKLQVDPRLEKLLEQNDDLELINELINHSDKQDSLEATKAESEWKFLRKSKSSKRALISNLILISTSIMMGSLVFQVYAEPLFKEAVPTMSANFCAILLAIDFLIASLICILAIDRFGRKFLMIFSAAMSGVCTLLLGSQLHFHWAPHWATALLIYVYSFAYTVGASTVPFILLAEVFLPEVRGLCNSIAMSCTWIMNFVTLMIFNPLVKCLGLGPVFYVFSIICFFGAFYTQFYVPETKGLSVDEIQMLYLNRSLKKK